MRQSDTDMTEHIFTAIDHLMAKDGLHNLSMHKIAKAANISPGTIYIYFKCKEELLEQFARQVFARFQRELEKNYDESQSLFGQYRQMWWNIWHFLGENPNIILNMHQYQSLPGFDKVIREWDRSHWTLFCEKGQKLGVLCDLPSNILFSLGLESAMKIAWKQIYFKESFSEGLLESVIQCSWRAMQK
ncbi:TetR/AcrR family transcriptional regulator [Pasteurella dagmatis]|uniref:Transcriptional regulator, TetR family n=1 Tax=Pasteurella dagmatis ATCC 43325 TaxID=667128 RepID=C9PMB5_9PAST|nr:TetR/AcrR family transcriptional regulator [Pasteurella dagmatis]EEX51335.1 transcriptional regulator, TetR family [Pasteurella dagmatis ATCC 43325]SNV40817.1 TetR family transcriptional regulator [Pasteurella dagmatis]